MANDNILHSIRDNLNGQPGQPMLLGVCKTLATRLHVAPWTVRAACIAMTLLATAPMLVAYVLCGLLLDETSERTRGIFQGLFLLLRDTVEKLLNLVSGAINGSQR